MADRAALERAYALVALAGMILVVWERLNPDGPRDAWARFRARLAEYRQYRAAMHATLAEIYELPERELPEQPTVEPESAG